MKLDPTQRMHLKNVKTANEAWRKAKRDAAEIARLKAAEIVTGHQAAMDREVRLAFEAGVPKNQIGRYGLGTSAPQTVNESLARTEGLAETIAQAETDPLADRYQWDSEAELLTITLDSETVERLLKELDHWGPVPAGVDSCQFHLTNGRLDATVPSRLPGTENRHPVIAWAYLPENEREALDWLRERAPEQVPVEAQPVRRANFGQSAKKAA